MGKLQQRFFIIFLLSSLIVCFIYFFTPTYLNITDVSKASITIDSGGKKIEIDNEEKQELIKILQNVKFYKGASNTNYQSGIYGNSEITIMGNYNENYNFVHIYILENEPYQSFAQLSTNTKYRMKNLDVQKIVSFLHTVV